MLGKREEWKISGEMRNLDDCLLLQKVTNIEEKMQLKIKCFKDFKICVIAGGKNWEAEILEKSFN